MFKNQAFFVLFSMVLFFPLASNSEAVLWDLQIQANVENSPIYSGDRPIVSGIIIDHASKPVYKATVNIRSESMSIFTTTSQSGEFLVELGKHDRIPGNYIVNISATTEDGKTGISSIQFQVKGDLTQATATQVKLSTPEAKKYLDASPEDFEKNPIGFMLYNYYQKLYQEYLAEKEIEEELAQNQEIIEEYKKVANKLRLDAIEEYNPGVGIFSGAQYENYVNSLDDAVRDTVVEHLNFTKNLFEEAQKLRNEILENGGTVEEAQIAYLEKITVSRGMIENFDSNSINEKEEILNEISTEIVGNKTTDQSLHLNNDEKSIDENLPILVNVDGINVEVNYKESIFYVNVNGTVLEFFVNGEQITLATNSE